MRIVIHVDKHYDWEPVPDGVQVTKQDVDSLRVKPGAGGQMMMRVTKERTTYTEIMLAEQSLVDMILRGTIREGIPLMTRRQAVTTMLAREVMPHHAHRSWMQHAEVHDDGPDEKLFRSLVQRQIDAGNIDAEELEPMVAAYMEPATADDHRDHLHKHFRMKGVAK